MGNTCLECNNAESKFNKAINEANRQSNKEDSAIIKILLLGAGESGKSTLFKQMRILYGKSTFSEKQRKNMIRTIQQNIIYNLAQLIDKDPTKLEFSKELATLWSSEKVQQKYKLSTRSAFQIQDNLEYFMDADNFSRIIEQDYIPNDQDMLRTRVRTSGIVEESFEIDETQVLMVDVGGQRNERRKWIHAFEDVDCILFVAAISEYDQVLFEDNSVQRLTESIDLFHKILTEKIFNSNGYILFLNKTDMLRRKLLSIPLRDDSKSRNMDYEGPTLDSIKSKFATEKELSESDEFENLYQNSLEYLKNKFISKIPSDKQVSIKKTCATDTQQINNIMSGCKQIFLQQSLKNHGFT